MRKDVETFIGAAVLGVVCTIGYQAIKAGVQVVKDKKAVKGLEEQLDVLDQLVERAENVKQQ